MTGIVVAIPISTEGKISNETESKLISEAWTVYEETKRYTETKIGIQ